MAVQNLGRHRQSGAYTPTLTIVANLAVLTHLRSFFAIHGDVIQVWTSATVDPTAAAAYSYRVSLPFGIQVAAITDIIGVCGPLDTGFGGTVSGNIANNEALIESEHDDTAATLFASFAYRVA